MYTIKFKDKWKRSGIWYPYVTIQTLQDAIDALQECLIEDQRANRYVYKLDHEEEE